MTDRDAGYREGIEAAAKVAERRYQPCDLGGDIMVDFYTADTIAKNIRALLPSTPDDGKADPVAREQCVTCGDDWVDGTPCARGRYDCRLSSTIPSPASDGAIRVTDEIVDYIARYGGACRDCADEDGVCPHSGLPCADRDKAIRHVLSALNYGIVHGFISTHAGDAAKESGGVLAVLKEALAFYDKQDRPHAPGEAALLDKIQSIVSSKSDGRVIRSLPSGEIDHSVTAGSRPSDTHAEVKG